MKLIRIIFFILFTTVICSVHVHAQAALFNTDDLSHVNIDDYSDEEIAAILQKANETGISQAQLLKLAADKGLPSEEIVKLKNRLQFVGKSAQQNKDNIQSRTDTAVAHEYDTSASKVPMQTFKPDQTIFGSELFSGNSLVFEPNLRIPAPAGYILGPDDEIVVSVYGYSEKKYNLTVNEQGEIYIPNVGPILVNGLTMEQATQKIKSRLAATIYRAINSDQTKVQVSLGKIRSIRITVIGQAKKPGTFTVSSLTTLFNALYLCGGPTSMGSYRDIEVIRGNNVKTKADLYDFLVNGNQKGNIFLQEGDVIRIPYYKDRVKISGKVKREGKFEMLDTESFNDLLKYCGGFTDDAYRGAVTVIRITDTERKIIDVESSQFDTFKPHGSDEYIVSKLQDEFGNRIVISGSVNRPGPYELSADITLKDLIEKAGGLTEDAYRKGVTIYRYLGNKTPTTVSADLDSVLDFGQKIYLRKNDSIFVHSIFDFTDKNFITVEGNVRKPGTVQWRENFTLHDLLLSVGGLTESGDSSNVEISRRIRNADINQANHDESEVFNINLANEQGGQNKVYLQPFDMVIVKTLPGYTEQRSVLVLGEVKSPGRYGLEKSGDRISDVLKRVGGFKASADSNSITIRRSAKSNLTVEEKQRLFQRILNINPDSLLQNPRLKDELYKTYDLISVNLEEALHHPNSSENLALEQGDILTVDRSTNLVKISGEVYYPTIVAFKPNRTLKYYVQQAGNFTSYARKNGALVIHPDGKAASVKHFLWFRSYPLVTPRSEVFVPQKNKSNRTRISIGELALMVSALGILASVIKF
jgi:protein involved in polysaccharide export with SLBB domain